MSELRLNIITREWVIIAPERAARPQSPTRPRSSVPPPAHDTECPFCPGNEAMSAEELDRAYLPGHPGWQSRVVWNMYPVLKPEPTGAKPHHQGLKHAVVGFGRHDVVIETPRHDLPLALFAPEEVECLMRVYRARYRALHADPRVAHITLFKNYGHAAGTSLLHPHSQVVGTPVVSYQVRERIRTMEDHFALYGECVLCRMIAEELDQQDRIIHVSPSFVAMVPYAALSSYHVWVFPRRHMAWFGGISDDEVRGLAETLQAVMKKLYYGLGNPAFNFLVRSAPRACTDEEYHWYLSIVPRVGEAAGFELGSGIYVNPCRPEDAAEFLRSVQIPSEHKSMPPPA